MNIKIYRFTISGYLYIVKNVMSRLLVRESPERGGGGFSAFGAGFSGGAAYLRALCRRLWRCRRRGDKRRSHAQTRGSRTAFTAGRFRKQRRVPAETVLADGTFLHVFQGRGVPALFPGTGVAEGCVVRSFSPYPCGRGRVGGTVFFRGAGCARVLRGLGKRTQFTRRGTSRPTGPDRGIWRRHPSESGRAAGG